MSNSEGIRNYLARVFSQNKVMHSYIVVGTKKRLPRLLKECALVAMCKSFGCGTCEVCNKIKLQEHQDVIFLPRDTAKNRITVADVSYLIDESYKRPVDNSQARVFLLDASDSAVGTSSEVWQNKLLKTLEEPLQGVYIFIGVTDAESLLPTVRSRCQILKEDKSSVQEVAQTLMADGFIPSACQIAAAMSGGSLDSAQRLMANSLFFQACKVAEDIALNMTSTKNALKFAQALVDLKDYVPDCLSFYTLLLAESLYCRLAPELCLLPSKENSIKKICQSYSISAARSCIELVNQSAGQLSSGGNVTLAVDRLLSGILEVKYRCRL